MDVFLCLQCQQNDDKVIFLSVKTAQAPDPRSQITTPGRRPRPQTQALGSRPLGPKPPRSALGQFQHHQADQFQVFKPRSLSRGNVCWFDSQKHNPPQIRQNSGQCPCVAALRDKQQWQGFRVLVKSPQGQQENCRELVGKREATRLDPLHLRNAMWLQICNEPRSRFTPHCR